MVTEKDIGLHFKGSDLTVAGNNSKGVFAKDDHRVIFWKNGLRLYEVVFNMKEKNLINIYEYFEGAINSPEITKEDIERLKK